MKNTIEQSNSSSLLNKSLKKFTLLEVIIAMAILSLAIVGILNYSVQASRRMAKASTKWEKEQSGGSHKNCQQLRIVKLGTKNALPQWTGLPMKWK